MSYPLAWGSTYWIVIHYAGTLNISHDDLNSFFQNFTKRLPCPSCSSHAYAYVTSNPVSIADDKFAYTVHFHNHVNSRLKKRILSLDKARKVYESNISILTKELSLNSLIFASLMYSIYANRFESKEAFTEFVLCFVKTFYFDTHTTLNLVEYIKTVQTDSLLDKKALIQYIYTATTGEALVLDRVMERLFVPRSDWTRLKQLDREKTQLSTELENVQCELSDSNNVSPYLNISLLVVSFIVIALQVKLIISINKYR